MFSQTDLVNTQYVQAGPGGDEIELPNPKALSRATKELANPWSASPCPDCPERHTSSEAEL